MLPRSSGFSSSFPRQGRYLVVDPAMGFRVSETALASTLLPSTPPPPAAAPVGASTPAAEFNGGTYAAAFERTVVDFRRLSRDDEAALSRAVQRTFRLPRLSADGMAEAASAKEEDGSAVADGKKRAKLRPVKGKKKGQELTPTFEELAGCVDLSDPKVRRIFAEGLRAREMLVTANLRLVLSYVGKLRGPDVVPADLVQEGVVGLIRAAEKYDPTTGFAFSTYAYSWIRSRVGQAIRRQESLVRIPDHSNLLARAIQRARRDARAIDDSDKELTEVELAKILDIDVKKVRAVLMRVPMAKGFVPMDHPGFQGLELGDRASAKFSPAAGSPDDVTAQPGGGGSSSSSSSSLTVAAAPGAASARGPAGGGGGGGSGDAAAASALSALSDYGGAQSMEQREQTAALLSLLRAMLSPDEYDALVTRYNLGPPAPYAHAKRALEQRARQAAAPSSEGGRKTGGGAGQQTGGLDVAEDGSSRVMGARRTPPAFVTASGVRPYVEVARLTNLSLHQSRYAVKSSLAKLRSDAVKDALRPFFEE